MVLLHGENTNFDSLIARLNKIDKERRKLYYKPQ